MDRRLSHSLRVGLLAVGLCGCAERCGQAEPAPGSRHLKLTHQRTVSLPAGTHRPEVLTHGGQTLAVVVQPQGPPGPGQVKHRLHRFDRDWKPLAEPTVISQTDAEHGEPADHRAALVGSELVVVYQTLRWKQGHPPEGAGPAEDHARDQSLVLARFDLSGKKLGSHVLVKHVADVAADNFPDHCLLWHGGRLLVGTGSRSGAMKVREVTPNGRVLATHRLVTSPATIPGAIGNSLFLRGGSLALFSSADEDRPGGLALVELSPTFGVRRLGTFTHAARDRRFPTGSLNVRGFTLVTYISLPRGTRPNHRSNHYAPYLMVLDGRLNVVADLRLGKGHGFSHVHPTLALDGDRLLVAWSKREGDQPRVQIEMYGMSAR